MRVLQLVRDPSVWKSVRSLYVGSGVLFVATIGLGILNVFTDGDLPRGQLLAHLHSGTIGWITLGVIATALWVFTGQRTVSSVYAAFVRGLVWVGLVAVAGYIATFYFAFNGVVPFWLLPVFGISSALTIWAGFLFTLVQLRRQPVTTTVHLLLFGALMVASVGATMGVLRGLTYAAGISPYPAGGEVDPIGAHAGPMDMYLALAFAGIVELLVRRDDQARWTKAGLTQMVLGVISAFIVAGALYFGAIQLAPASMLLFLLSFLFYVARVGWRTFTINPFAGGRKPAVFFGGLALPAYFILFVTLVMVFFIPGRELPHALGIVFVHVTFVGMATNLLLATHSAYAAPAGGRGWFEPAALWTLNVGLLAFFAGELLADRREGALLMALGVLLSLAAVWARLAKARPAAAREGQAAAFRPVGRPPP